MLRRSHGPQLGAVALAILALAGCNGGDSVVEQTLPPPTTASASAPTMPPTSSAAPTATTSAQEAAILRQYRAYFEAEPLAQRLTSKAERDAKMKQVAVDPALKATLDSMTAATAVGEVFYGQVVLRPRIEFVRGEFARILDCQDTSGYGRQNATTGAKVTNGIAGVMAVTTMVRGEDGVWRLGALSYPGEGSTCTA